MKKGFYVFTTIQHAETHLTSLDGFHKIDILLLVPKLASLGYKWDFHDK